MAEILGVQQSRINRYETGQTTPAPEIFIKYADYFDVSMDYLYCRTCLLYTSPPAKSLNRLVTRGIRFGFWKAEAKPWL